MAQRKASSSSSDPSKPGLQKVRRPPILLKRTARQISVCAGRLLFLVDSASVMSEGQMRQDEAGSTYFGTTTLLFPVSPQGTHLSPEDADDLKLAIELDPMARLSVLRIAHREACTRAGAPLDCVQAEIRVEQVPRGVLVRVEVCAPALNQRLAGSLIR